MTVYGFTGTQTGMTDRQRAYLRFICERAPAGSQFHHGDCIGADEEAARIAYAAGLYVVAHPPLEDDKRAYTYLNDAYREPLSYRDRNTAIVNACDELIAAPKTMIEKSDPRSGTWMTVRIARRAEKRVRLLPP